MESRNQPLTVYCKESSCGDGWLSHFCMRYEVVKVKNKFFTQQVCVCIAYTNLICTKNSAEKRLNPYHLIERMEYEGCNEAVSNITPQIAQIMPKIKELIFGIPVLTEIQKKFYLAVMEERYEKVLKPTCHKIMGMEMEAERQTESRKERRCR